jgi:hypothetical protein
MRATSSPLDRMKFQGEHGLMDVPDEEFQSVRQRHDVETILRSNPDAPQRNVIPFSSLTRDDITAEDASKLNGVAGALNVEIPAARIRVIRENAGADATEASLTANEHNTGQDVF